MYKDQDYNDAGITTTREFVHKIQLRHFK